MGTRLLAWPILCLALVEACTSDPRPLPTEAAPNATVRGDRASTPSCPSPSDVDRQIISLVPQGKKIIAVADFELIVVAYKAGKTTQAQQAMFQLWSKVLKAYF